MHDWPALSIKTRDGAAPTLTGDNIEIRLGETLLTNLESLTLTLRAGDANRVVFSLLMDDLDIDAPALYALQAVLAENRGRVARMMAERMRQEGTLLEAQQA